MIAKSFHSDLITFHSKKSGIHSFSLLKSENFQAQKEKLSLAFHYAKIEFKKWVFSKRVYIWRCFFLFNCQIVGVFKGTCLVSGSNKETCDALSKTLRDSRHLSKRLAHSHVLLPFSTLLRKAVLVTSHNELYVISPSGSLTGSHFVTFKHKVALCDILGRSVVLAEEKR